MVESRPRLSWCRWSNLPEDLLDSIVLSCTNRLKDYSAFAGVCKSWSQVALTATQRYMSSKSRQQLLVHYHAGFTRIQSIRKPCFKLMKHDAGLLSKRCMGFSFGYMIMVDQSSGCPSLIDPLSGHTIQFPTLPCGTLYAGQAVLSSPVDSSDCLLFYWGCPSGTSLSYCHLNGEQCWMEGKWSHGLTQNAIVCDQKLFVLVESGVVIMDLLLHPARMLEEAEYVHAPQSDERSGRLNSWHLVEVGREIWIIRIYADILQEARSLCWERKRWNRKDQLDENLAFPVGSANGVYFTTQDEETVRLWRFFSKDTNMIVWLQFMSKSHWDTGFGLV